MASDSEIRSSGVQELSTLRQSAVLGALALIAFCYMYSTLALSPVVTQVADEFDISIGRTGLAVTAYGLPGVGLAIIAGAYSDRYGRKWFVVGGMSLLGFGTIAGALAATFDVLVACRAVAGVGAAASAGSIFASVADYFSSRVRGRAIAVVLGTSSMAPLVGVPISGVVADATSWRLALGLVGVVALLGAALSAVCLPRSARPVGRSRHARRPYRLVAEHRPTRSLLLVGALATLPWATWTAYIVVFFQTTYDLSLGVASTMALTSGVGLLLGSQLGGHLGDRAGHREVLGVVLVCSAIVITAMTTIPTSLAMATGLNLVFASLAGARSVTYQTLLMGQLPDARATVMSIFGSITAGAMALGAWIGGVFVDASGFWLLGAFCAVPLAAGAVLVFHLPFRVIR